VEVALRGDITTKGPKEGMVVDFGDLKAYWDKELHPILDHQFLNSSLGHIYAPTAEHLSWFIHDRLSAFAHGQGCTIEFVRVWETDTAYAQVP
jgi:6-pyruvoyltetrahydropterin/6-carboxytetrahydropterin synthase